LRIIVRNAQRQLADLAAPLLPVIGLLCAAGMLAEVDLRRDENF
jgi:hypothetical protein